MIVEKNELNIKNYQLILFYFLFETSLFKYHYDYQIHKKNNNANA